MKPTHLLALLMVMQLLTSCSHLPIPTDDQSSTPQNYPSRATQVITEIPLEAKDASPSLTEVFTRTDFGQSARKYLEVLAEDIGHRLAGSGNSSSAAKYIQAVFEQIGYTPETQWFTAYDYYEGVSFESSNIIATKKGLSDQQIIVGAHYDSVDDEGSQGADDNASGVAVLLEVAEQVFDEQTPYTLVFVAFGAEEEGLWGSANYVELLNRSEIKNIIGMVNLDCLIAGDKAYIYGNEGPGSMRDWLLEDAKQKKLIIESKTDEDLLYEDGSPCECSDFDAFEKANIPYIYFESTNWDRSPDGMIQVDPQYGNEGEVRHSAYDTVEYIDETFPGRIDDHLEVFVTLLYDLVTRY